MTNEREVADVADAFLRRRSGIRHHVGVALLPDWLRRIRVVGHECHLLVGHLVVSDDVHVAGARTRHRVEARLLGELGHSASVAPGAAGAVHGRTADALLLGSEGLRL
jgi:hypothetical protein